MKKYLSHLTILLLSFFFISFAHPAFSRELLDDFPKNYKAYFPYFLEDSSPLGSQSIFQILNTTPEQSSVEIKFYPAVDSYFKKGIKFVLQANSRIDIPLENMIFFKRGSLVVSSNQEFAAQLILLPVEPFFSKLEKLKEQPLVNILAPSRLSELNQEGKVFVLDIPSSYLDRAETKIFVFNPHPQEIQVMLEKVLGDDVQTLKVLRLSSLGSGSLDVPADILEKGENINLKLVSSQSMAAVVKTGHFPLEQFRPLNPNWQELSASLNAYLFPFGQEGSLKNFYLFLENNDGISQNLVNLGIAIRQDGDIFYKKKNFSLPPQASLKLFPKDMDLGLADLNSLEYICLTGSHTLQGGLVCSVENAEFKFPFLSPSVPQDEAPPSSPILSPVISPTNINYQTIFGSKDADSCLWLNNEPFIPFDDQKDWQYELFFEKGENTFEFVAKDRAGNASGPVSVAIVFDPDSETPESLIFSQTIAIKPVGEGEVDGEKVDRKQPPVDIKKPGTKPYLPGNFVPTLYSVAKVIDSRTVEINYSETVTGAETAGNYTVTPDLGISNITAVSSDTYRIAFQNTMETNATYRMAVNSNVKDSDGNLIDPQNNWAEFTGIVFGQAVLLQDLAGENAFDYFGHAIALAGDINGDGFEDVLVGAYAHSEKDVNAGKAYIFYGIPDLGQPGVSISGPDIALNGQNDYDYFGYSVSSAGDVNGDGYADFLIGAPYNDEGADDAGKAYLYFGGGFGKINSLDPSPSLTFLGEAKGDNFGMFVTSLGDINGDGKDDILVGAPDNDERGDNAGKGYVYFGGQTMDNQPDLVMWGENPKDYFGLSAAKLEDINGDGFNDFAVGAYGNDEKAIDAGKVYVYYGGASLNNAADKTYLGEGKGDYFGFSMASAKLNGDSITDLVVSAYGNDEKGADAGKIYVYFGGNSFGSGSQSDLQILGEHAGDYFGYALSPISDLNADGVEDILAGAFGYDGPGDNSGRIYAFFGGAGMSASPGLIVDGAQAGDNFGSIVSPAGFFNNDNGAEIIMGAKGTDAQGQDVGKVYVYTTNFGKKKKPFIADTNLVDQDIRFTHSNSLYVELIFNEKMNTSSPVTVSFGNTAPDYNTLEVQCQNWEDEYTCAQSFDISKLSKGFNVVKIKGAKNKDSVSMAENYYYNVTSDQEKPQLDPNAVFVDANHVDIVYNEDMIYADFPQYYTLTPSVSLVDVEHVGENLTHYRLVTSASSRFRPNQSYTITAKSQIQDLAKNSIDPVYNKASFTAVDNASPVVNSFDIYNLDTAAQDFTNSLTVGVRMTDSDQDGSVVKWLLTTSPLPPASADFNLTSRPTSYTFADPQAGQKYLYAWVLDQSNNVSAYSAASQDSIELDAQGPDVVLDSIDPNPTNSLQITVTGKVEIPDWSTDNYQTIQVKMTGDIQNAPVTAVLKNDLTYVASVTLSAGDTTKTITATAYDPLGNPGAVATQTVLLDTMAPEKSTINPPATPTNISQQTLTGTKPSDASAVNVQSNGVSVSGVSYPSQTIWSVFLNLAEGKNSLQVTSEDLAGNESEAAATEIILDTTAPVIEMIYPTEGSVVNGK